MELIEQCWTAVRSWWTLCVLRLFQGGCLVDLEVVWEERSKVGKCGLVVEIVPFMLPMTVIGSLGNLILGMFPEVNWETEKK